jgi:hypothetical protein
LLKNFGTRTALPVEGNLSRIAQLGISSHCFDPNSGIDPEHAWFDSGVNPSLGLGANPKVGSHCIDVCFGR